MKECKYCGFATENGLKLRGRFDSVSPHNKLV